MNRQKTDPFLDQLVELLRLGPRRRREIRCEIEDHIASQLGDLMNQGLSYEQATARILADFGDAADLARRFGLIGQSKRWIMRSTLAASIVIATTVVTSFLMPPQPGNPLTPGAGGAALPDAPGAVREEVKGVPVVRDEDPADAAVRAALEKPVGEVNLEDVPLADVFAYLRELAGVNVIVEWTSLEAAGIERDRPVSVKLNSVKTGAALRAVLNLVGGSEVTLDYQIRDGILTIATAECLARHAEARLYCCSDLLRRPPPQWVQVEFDRSIAELRRSYGRESATFVEPKSAEIMNAIIERRTAELLDVIHNTVDPESWKTNGGAVGAITLLDDVLVIVQTQKNHEAIDRLLRNLLRARATANTAQ